MTYASRITGTGSTFPPTTVTNDDIARKLARFHLETDDQWIRDRTGIRERHHADVNNPEEHNSSLATVAARQALEMAGKTGEDIDQIIFATCSPDTLLPSSACWLQHKLGAPNAWAMDINAACSGFIYGLATADQFIQSGNTRTALVIGSEVLNPLINWQDRSSCILFGDGAGAAVVEQVPADSAHRILSCHMHSDGNLWDLLYVPAGGSSREVTPDRFARNRHKLVMNGREIFKHAVRTLTEYANAALAANGLTIDQIDWFVPHQANRRILEAVAQRLEVPAEKVVLNVERYGNTSSATIPTVFDEAVRSGKIQPGDLILMDAFGAGLTSGSLLMRW